MNKFKIILFILIGLIFSCTESDEETIETSIALSNFSTTINENPNAGLSLGTVEASTNQGNLTYSITEQLPIDAITIDSSTGELTVLTESLFDFETNPTITGIVKVESGDVFSTAIITINLNDINEITVTAYDLEINLDHIPDEGEILGNVQGETNEGSVIFEILEQNPNEILQINPNTGELELAYFYNSVFIGNPMITVIVRVSNGSIFEDASVTVNLVSICETDLEPQLLAFYPMSSNAIDDSGFNNHGIVNGPILTNDRFSNSNSAYHFDGVDDEIVVSDNSQIRLTDEFTISAWVFPEEIKTQTIIRKGSAVNGIYAWPFGLGMSATNDIIFSITTDGELTQARKIGYNINEWYLISGVFKNQTMSLYVNDELVAIETVEGEFNYNTSPFLIGTRLNLPSSTFKGIIDDIRIYDKALCSDEIIELFEN